MTNYTFAPVTKLFCSGMKKLLFFVLLFSYGNILFAQKLKRADRLIIDNLKKDIGYLSSDKQEGRQTGTEEEQKAASYIAASFKSIGLLPKGENGAYLQEFEIQDGKKVNKKTMFIVNDREMALGKDYFPFAFSANASVPLTTVATSLAEKGVPWFIDIDPALEAHKGDADFNVYALVKSEAKKAYEKGATALVIYNTGDIKDNITFSKEDNSATVALPVFYLTKAGRQEYFKDASAIYDVKLTADLGVAARRGHNVIGFIDNKAPLTIIIGAHYDHIGQGEDSNPSEPGSKQIYNSANDNASGTAAVIELARMLKKSKAKKNNYLFIAFSGAVSGWQGSTYFTHNPTVDLSTVNYMVNMDMIGRLDDNTPTVNITGLSSSPVWSDIISDQKNISFSVKPDSIGASPGDHISFYRNKIPVLYFSTGHHGDSKMPGDDAAKINYTGELYIIKYIGNIIESHNKKGKLSFTPVNEGTMGTK